MANLAELVQWLVAFKADKSRAFYYCPEPVYSELRAGYLTCDNELTDQGDEIVGLVVDMS